MTGAQLKKRREGCGYSQETFAEKLGVHTMTVSRWERDAQLVPVYIDLALRTLERELIASKNGKQRKPAKAKRKAATK